MRRIVPISAALVLASAIATNGQDDGGGFLERTLEDALSGEGRDVVITGFQGALSSEASVEEITFSDGSGTWLRLADVILSWNRSALLRGRVQVERLTAAEIEFVRPPEPSGELPDAQASGFSLPELPVSVEIGEIAADRVTLGEALFGEATTLSVAGTLSLAGGEGAGRIAADRLDGKRGTFEIEGAYSNATEVLTLGVTLDEAPGGIVATLAGLPGDPSVALDLKGDGPLSDFAATLTLATDGAPRLEGALALAADPDAPDATRFEADLGGDIAPLFFPEYQAFFGPALSLVATGQRGVDGSLAINRLTLDAAQVQLEGQAVIGADGLPDLIDLDGQIAAADGSPVLLPGSGDATRIDRADLTVSFDAAKSEDWTGRITVDGLAQPGFSAETVSLSGTGRIANEGGQTVSAVLDFDARNLDLGNPDAEAALGETVEGAVTLDWRAGDPLRLTDLSIEGETYALTGDATVETLDGGVEILSEARVEAQDLSVFAGIAKRPLGGLVAADVTLKAQPVAGLYDVTLAGTGESIRAGIAEVDALLAGETTLDIAARRDLTGSHLDRFAAQSEAANVSGTASLTSGLLTAQADVTLFRTTIVAADLPGPLEVSANATGEPNRFDVVLEADGPTLGADASLEIDLRGAVPGLAGTADLRADDLSPFADRVGRPIGGAVTVRATGQAIADLSIFDIEAEAETRDLKTGESDADAYLAGEATLSVKARKLSEDIVIETLVLDAPSVSADLQATLSPQGAAFAIEGAADLTVTDLAPLRTRLGLPLAGSAGLKAEGQIVTDLTGFDIRANAETRNVEIGQADADAYLAGEATLALNARRSGETTVVETLVFDAPLVSADVKATLTQVGEALAVDGSADLDVTDLAPLRTRVGLPLSGGARLTAEGQIVSDLSEFTIRADGETRNIQIGQPDADAILAGNGTVELSANRRGGETVVDVLKVQTPSLTADASGRMGSAESEATFDARLANVARWVPGFSGPATAKGTARQSDGGDWKVDVDATGPGGVRASANGGVSPAFDTLSIALDGSAPLGIANRFIQPRAVSGDLGFDLRVDGPPALGSVSGRVSTSGARFTAPSAGVTLTGIDARVDLASSRATIATTANVRGGGSLSVSGPVTLNPPYNSDLAIQLTDVILSDPTLYRTEVDGRVTFSGAATGGASIGGALVLEETELRIPDSTSGGLTTIPEITHRNEPAAVRRTRGRAGLLESASNDDGSSGPAFPLNMTVSAPNRIFLRGRGLEAELGGGITLRGTTANVIPSGQFSLIRGRLDILGQRVSFTEGNVTLQGDFDPFIRLVAETDAEDVLVRIIVEGLASAPEVRFASEPQLPEDEVLARLLFGRGLDTLSPLQAAQLASAVATLAGRGGEGIVGRLRQDFGLDDLDVSTGESGGTQVRAGKYISDNAYTDITVDSEEGTEASINLDITPSITVRGKVGSTGNTGLGIFFERDY